MYYKFWGKTEEKEYHLLAYHGLDACSVAQEWLDLHRPLVQFLADNVKLSHDILRGILLLFTALHDVGKFSITFQNICPDFLRKLQDCESKKGYPIRHDQLGWMLWCRVLRNHLMGHLHKQSPLVKKEHTCIEELLDVFARIAFGHHGLPPKQPDDSQFDSCFREPDRASAKSYMDDLLPMVLPDESLRDISQWAKLPKQQRKVAVAHWKTRSWQFAGVIVLSDWIASGKLFPFHNKHQPLTEYYAECRETARRAFGSIGLYSAAPPSSTGFEHLFPDYADCPTPLQRFCDTITLTGGPQLWVLEDVTGSGKTEAACTLVSRMMKEKLATGVYVGLPTMATSNAMYERLANVYHLFFSSDSRPSLVLSHGARHLSKAFRKSYSLIQSDMNRDGAEDSSANCSAWLADSTKKSLLADVGIGTLDQVLLGSSHHDTSSGAQEEWARAIFVEKALAKRPGRRRRSESVWKCTTTGQRRHVSVDEGDKSQRESRNRTPPERMPSVPYVLRNAAAYPS
ncbi:MAG TPA: CRISPR-associated endonuclease Cas3'' [Phycisphaerae bacterium]|nr:CRISPR-associated endonuclease Cas3'' [Phycisphaerae bacterium]